MSNLTPDEQAELARLEAQFEAQGGRGVELADRIDALRAKRDESRTTDSVSARSEGMKIRIIRQYDDHEPVVLGQVDIRNTTADAANKMIDRAWVAFQNTFPDTDSQFIDYLVENEEGVTAIEDDFTDIAVG